MCLLLSPRCGAYFSRVRWWAAMCLHQSSKCEHISFYHSFVVVCSSIKETPGSQVAMAWRAGSRTPGPWDSQGASKGPRMVATFGSPFADATLAGTFSMASYARTKPWWLYQVAQVRDRALEKEICNVVKLRRLLFKASRVTAVSQAGPSLFGASRPRIKCIELRAC